MDICYIDDDYTDYLRQADSRVYISNQNYKRIYAGVVFKINGIDYYAPLTSPKPKHKNLKDSLIFIKINNGKYGAIQLNNMIPVPYEKITIVDTTITKKDTPSEVKYKSLVKAQLKWINQHDSLILNNANKLYNIITRSKINFNLRNICNDFTVLENSYEQYIRDYLSIDNDPASKSK